MCRTHVTGDLTRPTGKKWGKHWQASWWTTRMLAGAKLIWNKLTSEEQDSVRRVAEYEANLNLDRKVPGGATDNTRAEENAWDSEILAWASCMFPDHPNASKWADKAKEFFMNTLSAPQDLKDETIIDDKPVKDWTYTTNIYSDYTIENHGGYHFCYMACPLHSLSWAYYGYKANNKPVPPQLFHHYRDVYSVIKQTFLFDSRFAYLGGKDWPRYAYGLYFIMPALVVLQNEDNDTTARLFERKRFELFDWESRYNKDGTFFSQRFTKNVMVGRLLEYETDCAAMLGLAYLLHKERAQDTSVSERQFLTPIDEQEFQQQEKGVFQSKESQFIFTRDDNWFCSWSWNMLSRGSVMGLVIPRDGGDLAEWGANQFLSSYKIKDITDKENMRVIIAHQEIVLDNNSFATIGIIHHGKNKLPLLEERVGYIALGNEHQTIVIDQLRTLDKITLTRTGGLHYYLTNDIFNGNKRTIFSNNFSVEETTGSQYLSVGYYNDKVKTIGIEGTGGKKQTININSSWLNIDNKLGFIYIPLTGQKENLGFVLTDNTTRNAPFNSLLYEFIDFNLKTNEQLYESSTTVHNLAFVITCSDTENTVKLANSTELKRLEDSNPDIVGLIVPTIENNSNYLIVANFGKEKVFYSYKNLNLGKKIVNISNIEIPALGVVVNKY